MIECEIYLSFEDISVISKYMFKNIVQIHTRQMANCYLLDLQAQHSKTKFLTLSSESQSYLTTRRLSITEKQTLFMLRCRANNCKNNYKSLYKSDMTCIFCCEINTVDCVEHYMECKYLLNCQMLKSHMRSVNHSNIYGDIEKQIRFVKIWNQIEIIRHEKINNGR